MEKLEKLRVQLHTDVKNLRNIEYMIKRESFSNLWIISDKEQRERVSLIIVKRDKMRLINWIRKHPSLELGEMSILQLKEKAKELKIRNWSRMSKTELLMILNGHDSDEPESNLTVEEMIQEIKEFEGQMEPLMDEAGIPEDYLSLPEKIKTVDPKYIEEGHEWISKIFETVFRDARSIKNLLSDEMWKRYSIWEDFADHREVILLKDALANLKKQVINVERPVLFKKSRIKLILERALKRRKSNDG